MATLDLAALRAIGEKATKGPQWEVKPLLDNNGKPYATLYQTWVFVEPTVCGLWASEGKDLSLGEFIATARNNWNALLDELEQGRKCITELEKRLEAK